MLKCTIYNEDCLKTMVRMPSEFVDLTVTSPPYDNLRKYEEFAFNFESTAQELFRVTKNGGVVVWVVADATIKGSETGTSFRQALFFKECGFRLHDTMIYAKNSYTPLTHNRYEQAFEYMFVFSKNKPSFWHPVMIPCVTSGSKRNRANSKARETTYAERRRSEITTVKTHKQHPNIFYYDVGKNEKSLHNAPFPYELAENHILSWSGEYCLVYDPFMGSGTTAKAALNHKRNVVGSEISENYCREVIEPRLLSVEAEKYFIYGG
jgi:DNA modification methylase